MQVKANGIAFNCQIDGGSNAPWLIFSNSLATNLSMWDEQARALGKYFKVLRYDQRGHGMSEAPEGRYAFATLLADVIALMNVLAIRRAHFCGLSLGGATALGLAQQHPDRIDRAIVCDSPCMSTPASAKQWEERMAAAKIGGMAALVEPTLQRWFPAEVYAANPSGVAKVRDMVLSTPINGFIGCCAALADHNFRSAVASVTRPVLFMVGEKDPPNAVMREMHKELDGSQFIELAGAGHISNIEQPDAFTRALEKFLTT